MGRVFTLAFKKHREPYVYRYLKIHSQRFLGLFFKPMIRPAN